MDRKARKIDLVGSFTMEVPEMQHVRPVLRPLNYVFWDTLRIPASGGAEVALFQDCKHHPDQGLKDDFDTDMALDGMVGHPDLFDMTNIRVCVEKYKTEKDLRAIVAGTRWEFFRGQNTVLARMTISMMTPYIVMLRANTNGVDGSIRVRGSWPYFTMTPCTPDRAAVRFCSVDLFGIRATVDKGVLLSGPAQVKFGVCGALYQTN